MAGICSFASCRILGRGMCGGSSSWHPRSFASVPTSLSSSIRSMGRTTSPSSRWHAVVRLRFGGCIRPFPSSCIRFVRPSHAWIFLRFHRSFSPPPTVQVRLFPPPPRSLGCDIHNGTVTVRWIRHHVTVVGPPWCVLLSLHPPTVPVPTPASLLSTGIEKVPRPELHLLSNPAAGQRETCDTWMCPPQGRLWRSR